MRFVSLLGALIGGAMTTIIFLLLLALNIGSWGASLMSLGFVVVLCGVIGMAVPLVRPFTRVAGVIVLGVGVIAIVVIKLMPQTPLDYGSDVFVEIPNWLLIGPVLLVIAGAFGIWTAWKPSKRTNRKALDDPEQTLKR